MLKNIIISILGFALGFGIGFFISHNISRLSARGYLSPLSYFETKKVVGFLPYWLLGKADADYSTLTTLTYFGLTLQEDGTILKMMNEQETEPGWYTLNSGKTDRHFKQAKENGQELSLLVFSADEETISKLMEKPVPHAQNVIKEVVPIMKKYGFTDLNVDIESVAIASEEERKNFTEFTREIKKGLDEQDAGTLTIDASPTALIKDYLINLSDMAHIVDYIVLMTYDFHYPGSAVTGPVSPLGGGDTISEFDNEQSVAEALQVIAPEKILLGMPLYGYEWETLNDFPRAAVIPGTGITASHERVEKLLASCDTCIRGVEEESAEAYIIYQNEETGTYHQLFYPDKEATQAKVKFVQDTDIGGMALWALGYEGREILEPLRDY